MPLTWVPYRGFLLPLGLSCSIILILVLTSHVNYSSAVLSFMSKSNWFNLGYPEVIQNHGKGWWEKIKQTNPMSTSRVDHSQPTAKQGWPSENLYLHSSDLTKWPPLIICMPHNRQQDTDLGMIRTKAGGAVYSAFINSSFFFSLKHKIEFEDKPWVILRKSYNLILKACVLKAWLPVNGLLGSDWSMRTDFTNGLIHWWICDLMTLLGGDIN
jgi:hypothetical protein